MEKYFYSVGYNKALDDVITLIITSNGLVLEDLMDRVEKSKIININDVIV